MAKKRPNRVVEEMDEIFKACVKLNEFYPITNDFTFAPDIVNANPYMTIPLPTEVVVHRTTIVTPKLARIYMMRGQVSNLQDILITTKKAKEEQRRLGKKWARQDVLLVEVWEDCGDDGHVAFNLVGWRPVTSRRFRQNLELAKAQSEARGRTVLPMCMSRIPRP